MVRWALFTMALVLVATITGFSVVLALWNFGKTIEALFLAVAFIAVSVGFAGSLCGLYYQITDPGWLEREDEQSRKEVTREDD
ncbi:MAG: hypothetical protein GY700_06440 [Propionibacteriaceae bacterium]|nr:hypothetical protein [Propionibacteriaceae bacterium]